MFAECRTYSLNTREGHLARNSHPRYSPSFGNSPSIVTPALAYHLLCILQCSDPSRESVSKHVGSDSKGRGLRAMILSSNDGQLITNRKPEAGFNSGHFLVAFFLVMLNSRAWTVCRVRCYVVAACQSGRMMLQIHHVIQPCEAIRHPHRVCNS